MRKFWSSWIGVIIIFVSGNSVFSAPADTLWTKAFGGTQGDCGYAVQKTSEGGFIIAGGTGSYGAGGYDAYLLKTNQSGDTTWTKTFGGSNTDIAYSLQETADKGFIMAGGTFSYGAGDEDVYIVRTNSSGDTAWTRTIGGTNTDYGYSARETSDGGFIIAGTTESYGAGCSDVYLIKLDQNGDTVWTKTIGGIDFDYGYSVRETYDKGFIIAGGLNFQGIGGDAYLVKTDSAGDTLWTKIFGGINSDLFYSVQETSDSGFIMAGGTFSYGAGSSDIYIVKTDSSGDTMWTRAFGGIKSDMGYSVQGTADNGFVVVGYTSSYGAGGDDIYLLKTDQSGQLLWTMTFGGTADERGYSVGESQETRLIITGETASYGAGGYDIYLVRTGKIGIEESEESGIGSQRLKIYPNPFSQSTVVNYQLTHKDIKIQIYDMTGRLIKETKDSVIGKDLKAGIYFVKAQDCKLEKIIKLK